MKIDRNKKLYMLTLIPFVFFIIVGSILSAPRKNGHTGNINHSYICKTNREEITTLAVCDGDTIVVGNLKLNSNKNNFYLCKNNIRLPKGCFKIRLIGIDAFEHGQNKFAEIGKQNIEKNILNEKVCIELDEEKYDKYGRTLAYVFKPLDKNNIFINEEQVKNGYALTYPFKPNLKYSMAFENAQVYARNNMIGIWAESDYIVESPSDFRKKQKSKKFSSNFPKNEN